MFFNLTIGARVDSAAQTLRPTLATPLGINHGGLCSVLRTFFGIVHVFVTAHERNTINSTSGFKVDIKFGFPVPKNI